MPKTSETYSSLLEKMTSLYRENMQDLSTEGRNERMLKMNWNMGRYIVEVEQNGNARATYGKQLVAHLAEDLTRELGSGFSKSSIKIMRQFYNEYKISQTSGQLTWGHYTALMTVRARKERAPIEKRAIEEKLPIKALETLVREVNGVTDERNNRPVATTSLVPRVGQFNILKVVDFARADKEMPVLDCGFRQLAYMPVNRSPELEPGEYVKATHRTANGGKNTMSIKRIECAPGERYCFKGFVQRVIDGDTIKAVLELGTREITEQPLRLRGVNAKELGSETGDSQRTSLVGKLKRGAPIKVLTYHRDMYGRYIADVFYDNESRFLNEELR